MIRQLLSEGEESLIRWKKQLAQALGDNGQVIIDMLPDLEMIIGEQPEAPELAPEENRNRFRLVFQNFIRVFTSPEHPLVLFLDDLQWADSSSLTLIEDLLRDYEAQGFLLIGAYRDHEAEGGPLERVHPLRQWIENLKEHQLSIEELQLLPLELSHVKQLLQETFRENEKVINDLAELCHSKTGGNPFFLTRFLESLYQEKLIIFDPEKGRWHWDLECVQKQAFTGNVVELMVNKIQKLPDETIQALSHAAIFGNRFPLHLLSLLYEHSPAQTSKILWPALKEELILPTDQTYKLIDEESELLKVIYLFAHDRIQKAAYSLNEAKRLPQLHLKAGYLLKEQLNEGEQEELFFEMVNHLNQSISLVTEPEKRWELIALNLKAGQKAQLASAYRPSLNYLLQGISLLRIVSPDEASWTSDYSLTLNLYQYAAKSAYMLGEYEQMEVLINTALGQISSVLDQCVFQQIKISSLSARHEFQRVIEIGLETLNALGVVFPKSPNKGHVLLGLLQTKFRLRNKVLARLPNAPRMIDPDMLEAMKILEIIGPIAYQTSPDLFVLIVFQIIHLSLQHGIAPASSSGFTACGIILCGLLKEMDTGNRVGQIALYLNQKFDFVAQNAKSKFIFHQFIAHWKTHPNQSLPGLRESYQDGIEVGDIEFAAYAICSIPGYVFLTGSSLEEAQAEASTTLKIVESLNQQTPLLYVRMGFSAISQLMEDQDETSFQELDDEILQELYNANDQTGLSTIFTYKLITAYLFEKHTQAQEYAAKITHPDTLMGLALFATLSFYDALNRLSLAAQQQGKKNKKLLRIARKHQKNLKAWGKHAPMTYQHKWDLVEAEWQKNLKNPVQAAKHYNRAIDGARKNEFLHEEALANELAGRFYLENSQEFIAMAYLKQAHYLYDRWGAKAKVKQLNQQYKTFLATHAEPSQTSRSTQSIQGTVSVTNTSQRKDLLDLGSIFKSSQTISGEIQLEQLLSKLMRIVIENAGAQKGFLLLKKEKQFWIEAQGVVDQEEIAVLQSIPMDSGPPLSLNLLSIMWHEAKNIWS